MPILRLGGSRPVSPQVSEVPTTGGLIRKGHAPTEARGAFGLGTAQTIGARPPLGLREFVPQTLATARQFGRSLVTGDVSSALRARSQLGPSIGLDVANAAFLPVSVGVEQATRLMAGQPLRPASVVTRQALQGFPEDDRLTSAVRLGLETGAINAAPAALRGVGAGLIRLGRAAGRVTEPVRILRAPVEQLVTRARASGQEAATILRTLREAKSPKYQPVFAAVQAQRQAPRRITGFLPAPSQRGAAALPPVPIEPGDLVRFGKQIRRATPVDPTTQKVVLLAKASQAISQGQFLTGDFIPTESQVSEAVFKSLIPAKVGDETRFLLGGTAAGKSSVARGISAEGGFAVIDPDIFKTQFPGFSVERAAQFHEASSVANRVAVDAAIDQGVSFLNVVTGRNIEKFSQLVDRMQVQGKTVVADYIYVPLQESIRRNELRRVSKRGLHIPQDAVIANHQGGLRSLFEVFVPRAQRVSLVANPLNLTGEARAIPVAEFRNGQMVEVSDQNFLTQMIRDWYTIVGKDTSDAAIKATLNNFRAYRATPAQAEPPSQGGVLQPPPPTGQAPPTVPPTSPVGRPPFPERFAISQRVALRRLLQRQAVAAKQGFTVGQRTAEKLLITPRQSLVRQGRAFEAGFKRGTDEQKAQLIAAFRQQSSDIQAIQSGLIQRIRERVPAPQRGKFLNMVTQAQTKRQVVKAFTRIEQAATQAQKRQLMTQVFVKTRQLADNPAVALEYRQQIKALAAQLRFTKHRPTTLRHLEQTRAFIERQRQAGKAVDLPVAILEKLKVLNQADATTVSVEDLERFQDDIAMLEQAGRTKQTARVALYQAEKDRHLASLTAGTTPIEARPLAERTPGGPPLTSEQQLQNIGAKIANELQRVDLAITPQDVVFDLLDGGKGTYDGTNTRVFKRTIDADYSQYLDLKDAWIQPLQRLGVELKLTEPNFERIAIHAYRVQPKGMDYLRNSGLTDAQIGAVQLTPAEQRWYDAARTMIEEP